MKVVRRIIEKSSSIRTYFILFLVLLSTHVVAMMLLEGWTWDVALWFTVTAGTTVGFGDYSPSTGWGRIATTALIFIPFIPIFAILAAELVGMGMARRDRKLKGNWNWNMSDHIVFINWPSQGGANFFANIITELRASSSHDEDRKIIIVTDKKPDGLPQKLVDLGVKLVTGRPNNEATLERAAVADADRVVVLCEDPEDSRSDSLVFDITSLVKEAAGEEGPSVIAEAALESTKVRLKKLGVANVIRPIRAYPELMARTIISPGSEQIIENLFNSSNEECLRFDYPYKGKWLDLMVELVQKEMGTPIAVETTGNVVRTNLKGSDIIDVQAVFLIVSEDNNRSKNFLNQDLLATA